MRNFVHGCGQGWPDEGFEGVFGVLVEVDPLFLQPLDGSFTYWGYFCFVGLARCLVYEFFEVVIIEEILGEAGIFLWIEFKEVLNCLEHGLNGVLPVGVPWWKQRYIFAELL
jgi:hypothetical protein